jgi:hypothetical protein
MHAAYESFRECGWASFLCVLIGMMGVVVGLVGVVLLATKARNGAWIVGTVALALGVLSLGAGLLGRATGLARTEAALSGASVDASMKERIRAQGMEEANQCISVGAAAGALPFVMGALAVGIGLAVRKKPAP